MGALHEHTADFVSRLWDGVEYLDRGGRGSFSADCYKQPVKFRCEEAGLRSFDGGDSADVIVIFGIALGKDRYCTHRRRWRRSDSVLNRRKTSSQSPTAGKVWTILPLSVSRTKSRAGR